MDLHTIKLTMHQKEVLVRIYTAATPELGKSETEFGEYQKTAAEILDEIGAIDITSTSAQVTQAGMDLMKSQGLLDDSNTLTQEVEQFKQSDNVNVTDDVDVESSGMMDDLGLEDNNLEDIEDDILGPSEEDITNESLIQSINKQLLYKRKSK